VNDAVKAADVVMILLPMKISWSHKNNVEANIKQELLSGFLPLNNVHYNQVVPRADLDVWMVA
jgi:ketol-acid reductoisomerase